MLHPFSNLDARTQRFVIAFAVLAAVVCLFLFPIFRGETLLEVRSRQNDLYPWKYSPTSAPKTLHYDQADTFYPWQVFMNNALRSGELPLWNPYSFAGEPFFANATNGVLYPPRTILSLLVSPARVHDLLLLSHMLLGGLFMYLLLTDVSLSFPACLFGAIAWMTNSFMLAWMALEQFIVVEAWLPLALLLLRWTVLKASWPASIACSIVLALTFLGGNMLFAEMVFVISGAWATYILLRKWRDQRVHHPGQPIRAAQNVTLIAVPFLLSFGLIAVQLLPTLQIGSSLDRRVLSYKEFLDGALSTSSLKYFFIDPGIMPEPYDKNLFLGTPTALLALIGFWRRHQLASYARWLAVVTLLVVLGTPLAWLAYRFFPGFDRLTLLARILFAFDFAMAVLAAFGVDLIIRHNLGLPFLRSRVGRPAKSRYVIAGVLTAIVIAQMYVFRGQVVRHQPNDSGVLYPETALIHTLKADANARFLPLDPAFFGSTAMAFDLQSAGGYDSLLPDRVNRLWRVVSGEAMATVARDSSPFAFATRFTERSRFPILPRLSVTHMVTPPGGALDPNLKEFFTNTVAGIADRIYTGRDGDIYKLRDPFPRAYVVYGCQRVDASLAALQLFMEPTFDPSRAVVLEDSEMSKAGVTCSLKNESPASQLGVATVTRRSLNTLVLRVNAASDGWLVVNESWDPGWSARVDSLPAPVLPGDYAFRALPLTAGDHIVTMRYQPSAVTIGLIISSCTVAILIGLFTFWFIRRGRNGL